MGGVTWAHSEGVSVQPYSSIHVHSGWASRRRLCTPTLVQKSSVSCLEKSQREQSNTLILFLLFSSLSVFVKIVSFTRKNNAISH